MSEYVTSLLLVVLVSVFTVYPLFLGYRRGERGIGDKPEVSRLEQLYEKRDLYYSSIKDIELDRDMGKLSEQDYAELVSRYKEKAVAVTKLISELQSVTGDEKITGEARTSPFEAPLSQTARIMRRITLHLFLMSFCLFSSAVVPSAMAQVSGESVFIEGKCIRCHTLGRGRFVGPDLLGVGDRYSRDDLIRWARNPESIYAEKKKKPVNDGYPPMPPMNLSESEAQKVADYLLGYKLPSDIGESGTIKGRVRNITTGRSEAGQNVVLISYMGDRQQERRFAKSDSLGNFSFSSLQWDRSYEIMLFHHGVQYVSGKMVFLPGEDRITLDLPVYDTTTSDENVSLQSLNLIVYPDEGGGNVNVTSLYVFENSGNTVFTGEQAGSDTATLVFSIPEEAVDVTFSDGVNPEAVQRQGEKLYNKLPFLPGMKRIALGYSIPLSQIQGKFQIGFDYEVADLAVFVRKTELGVRVEQSGAVAEEIMIHDEAFLKYQLSDLKPGGVTVIVSNVSFLKSNLGRYLPVILFFVFVAMGVMYFFYGRNRLSNMGSEK